MAEQGRILIADDEETFLRSTADLLRREGYECTCAPDAIAAAKLLQSEDFELLVADIKMPGNPELELIRDLPHSNQGLPVILVTGYPSVQSARESIQLPVIAYMVKPVDIEELLTQVGRGVRQYRVYRSVCSSRRQMEEWREDLQDLENLMRLPAADRATVPVRAFLDLNMHNILTALMDMKKLSESLVDGDAEPGACHLLTCPQVTVLTQALTETIEVLQGTKTSFKSKALGELRRKLETVVARRDKLADPESDIARELQRVRNN